DFVTHQGIWSKHVATALEPVAQKHEMQRVLDVGCGPGVSAFMLATEMPHASVVGIDISDVMITRARRHHRIRYPHLDNVDLMVGDATDTGFEASSFDLVFGHSFLYLVPEPAAVLAEIRRVLRPGGQLVLTEPIRDGHALKALMQSAGDWSVLARAPLATSRFVLSMVLWRVVSGAVGQLEASWLDQMLRGAGFESVTIEPTMRGLGLLCRAGRR